MKNKLLSSTLFLLLLGLVFMFCKKNETLTEPNNFSEKYSISDTKIYNFSNPIHLIGANSFHVYGGGSTDMNPWNLDIVREFVGNIKETPLVDPVILDATGKYLHSMQSVVDSNRLNKRVTVFTAFGWDGTDATEYTGKNPRQTAWWEAYKLRLQTWANYFKNQPDAWIEIWNEPYRYDRADGYTDETWVNDMDELVKIVRSTGNNNIIVVPCAEQGQDESVLNNKGAAFLQGKKNILFDVHAYEKWLLVPVSEMGKRLENLKTNKLPVIFLEIAPMNAGTLMNPQSFLDSTYNRGISVCAWLWKYEKLDKDALLDENGLPNNFANNNWGKIFKELASRKRKP